MKNPTAILDKLSRIYEGLEKRVTRLEASIDQDNKRLTVLEEKRKHERPVKP